MLYTLWSGATDTLFGFIVLGWYHHLALMTDCETVSYDRACVGLHAYFLTTGLHARSHTTPPFSDPGIEQLASVNVPLTRHPLPHPPQQQSWQSDPNLSVRLA